MVLSCFYIFVFIYTLFLKNETSSSWYFGLKLIGPIASILLNMFVPEIDKSAFDKFLTMINFDIIFMA